LAAIFSAGASICFLWGLPLIDSLPAHWKRLDAHLLLVGMAVLTALGFLCLILIAGGEIERNDLTAREALQRRLKRSLLVAGPLGPVWLVFSLTRKRPSRVDVRD